MMSFTNCVTQDCSKSSPLLEFDNRNIFFLISTQESNLGDFHTTFFIVCIVLTCYSFYMPYWKNKLILFNVRTLPVKSVLLIVFTCICRFGREASLLT